MSAGELLMGLAFAGIGLLVVVGGVRHVRNGWMIRTNEPVDVREVPVADPPIEFAGTAELPADADPIEAPFSGAPALCYEYRVRERRRRRSRGNRNRNRNRTTWKTVDSDAVTRPFVVDDGTGRVLVDPDDATLALEWETVSSGRGRDALPPAVASTVDSSGDSTLGTLAGLASSRRRRYQEQRLEPGDPVHVFGAAVTEETTGWDADVDAKLADDDATHYQITNGDEGTAALGQFKKGVAALVFGLLFAGVGIVVVLGVL